ncbi:MAG TPA: hypothetical protein VFU38_01305 [Candidatus Krumholzibacteria bacterium]|nr:hypothetical protein [Candidatus Krumholzibacteria bacterium]
MRATTSLVVGIAVLAAVATARGEDAVKKAPARPTTTQPAAQPAPADTTAAAPALVPGAKVVLRENLYYYDAFNRRDPFRSLIDGAFNQSDRMELVNLSAVQLVGIVRGEVDRFALLEDASGYSYILRVGDRVHNGSVVSIGEDELVARVTNFGQTTTVRLRLVGR